MRLRIDVLASAIFMLLIDAAPLPALTAQPSNRNPHPEQKFISEVDVDSCRAQAGKWGSYRAVIPGNGRLYQLGMRAPAHTSRFIGAYIRVGFDTRYLSTCPVNFPLPPVWPMKRIPASYIHQSCRGDSQDMSVGGCIVAGPSMACKFKNPPGSHEEYVEMSSCWSE
jgi:hypothetical protein